MKRANGTFRSNRKCASQIWGELSRKTSESLRHLTERHGVSVIQGDVLLMEGNWYITHAGLLRIALRQRCSGIRTALQERQSDPPVGRWVFKATVYKSLDSKGFVGFGDADPSNVSPMVRGAEMRVAETRAVNRALRKAYGIGLCSVEELGSFYGSAKPSPTVAHTNGAHGVYWPNNGQPRLRDRLCLLIRQFNLDPTLVKAYAADFCGTQSLKDASRDRVESFISQLAAAAKNDRDALICKLNSYAQPAEVKP